MEEQEKDLRLQSIDLLALHGAAKGFVTASRRYQHSQGTEADKDRFREDLQRLISETITYVQKHQWPVWNALVEEVGIINPDASEAEEG
jgi:hypothetical protein